MTPEEIILKHPSLCYTCRHARKPAAEENQEKGYVGCAFYTRESGEEKEPSFNVVAKELATGWVDLRAKLFGPKSGIITNFQLLTNEVKTCAKYEEV
jgi:hypothetical protein